MDRFDLPRGEYRLRFLVLNHLSGAVSLSTVPISVGARDRDSPIVLPPLFLDLSAGWLVVVDPSGPAKAASWRYPFTLGKRSFAPAVRPVLRPDETIGVCLMGTHLSQPGLVLETRVLNREGRAVPGGLFTLFGRTEESDDGLDRVLGSFQAAGLTAGEYRFEVIASTQDGMVLTRSGTDFSVQN